MNKFQSNLEMHCNVIVEKRRFYTKESPKIYNNNNRMLSTPYFNLFLFLNFIIFLVVSHEVQFIFVHYLADVSLCCFFNVGLNFISQYRQVIFPKNNVLITRKQPLVVLYAENTLHGNFCNTSRYDLIVQIDRTKI